MSACEMSVEFDTRDALKAIAENIKLNFLTPQSNPTTISEAMQASSHILKSIANTLIEGAKEPRILAHFARNLGLHKGLDEDKELDEVLKEMKAPKELHDLLKMFLNHLNGKHEKCAEACAHD